RRAYAHHQRNVGTVNVGVHQSDFATHAREGDGEVHRDGGLADSAFTRSDRYQILHSRDRRPRHFALRWMWTHWLDSNNGYARSIYAGRPERRAPIPGAAAADGRRETSSASTESPSPGARKRLASSPCWRV